MKKDRKRIDRKLGQTAKGFARSSGFRLLAGLLAAAGVLLILRWMASEVFEGETVAFDDTVRQTIHGFATPVITRIMIGMSFIGSPVFLIGLGIAFLIVLLYLHWIRAAVLFLITMAGEIILDVSLKGIYARVRPDPFFDYLLPTSFSFPSGHALGSFCFYGIVAWIITTRLENRWIVWSIRTSALLLVLMIGISRVYLGVHYPTDVVAGYVAAFIWTLTVILVDAFFEDVPAKIE